MPTSRSFGRFQWWRAYPALLIGLGTLGFILATNISLKLLLEPSYRNLEVRDVERNITRVQVYMEQRLEAMAATAQDYAAWDASYRYIDFPTRDFEDENFQPEMLKNLDLSLVAFVNLEGQVIFSRVLNSERTQSVSLPSDFLRHVQPGSPLQAAAHVPEGRRGYLLLDSQPWLVAVKPVLTNVLTGPPKGIFIVGRPLDAQLAEKIRQTLAFTVYLETPSAHASNHPVAVTPLNTSNVQGHYQLFDLYGRPIAELGVEQTREVYQQGLRTLNWATLAIAILAIIAALLFQILLKRITRVQNERLVLEQRYRAVIQQASEGMALVEIKSLQLLETNHAWRRILNYSTGLSRRLDLPGLLALPPQVVRDWIQEVQTRGQADFGEHRYSRSTTQDLYLEISGSRITYADREYLLVFVRDVTLRKRQQTQIEQMAYFDSLTGLANRRFLQEHTVEALAVAERMAWSVAFLYLDLDRFKSVNDTLGHDQGDELLVQISQRLSACVRDGDTLARLGGDEFGILLYQATRATTQQVGGRILDALHTPFSLQNHQVQVGASIGVACYPDHGSNLVELMKSADIAMYHAKRSGGGMAFFDPQHNPYSHERLEIETRFRKALATPIGTRQAEEIYLHYQPVINLKTGKREGCEALVRWLSQQAWVPPNLFIPIAEDCNLIFPLDQRVIQMALAQWSALGASGLQLSLNLSARTVCRHQIIHVLEEALATTGFPPHQLCLEITETALIQHPETTREVLISLKDLGLRLALDDFGSGYASVAYLRRLPLDRLKLDRTLTAGLGVNDLDERLVLACIAMGHSLGLEVVAEGIERPDQLTWLQAHACDYAQGFLFGRPQPWPLDNLQDGLVQPDPSRSVVSQS